MSLARVFGGTENADIMTKRQEYLLNDLSDLGRAQLGRGISSYQTATGQSVVPGLNQNITSAFSGAQDALAIPSGLQDAVQQAISGAGDPEGVQAMYQAQLAPAQYAFEDQMRQLANRYGDTYGKTGALPYMAGIAGSRFGADQYNTLANLTYADRQAAADRQIQGIGAGIGVSNLQSQNLRELLGMGDVERTYAAQGAAEDYQQWNAEQAWNNPWLQTLGMALGTQAHGQQEVTGILPGVVGAITDIGGMFSPTPTGG